MKRILSFIVVLTLILSMVPTALAFENVSGWAEESVETMDDLGLIPDSLLDTDLKKGITRLDMCRIAMETYEFLTLRDIPVPALNPFKDTDDEDVARAYAVGLVKGNGNGTFKPDQILTRAEFFCFVSNLLNAVGYPIDESDYAGLDAFSDAASLPSWAVQQTKLAVGLGIVKGDDGRLAFNDKTTAEQAITMFCRAYEAASLEALDPPEVEIITEAFQNASRWSLYDYLYPMEAEGLIPEEIIYSSMIAPITRGEMCKVAIQTYKTLTGLGSELDGVGSSFTDTKDKDIALAHYLGIVNGYTDGTFRPDNHLTRQELFKITVNFLNALGYPQTDAPSVDLSKYPDSGKLNNYAKPTTRLLISLGLVVGDENKHLNPTTPIVREEALVIFYRAYNFVLETPPAPDLPDTGRDPETERTAQAIADLAVSLVDEYPYVSGGESPAEGGFDCSGLIYYCYKEVAGITISRTTSGIWANTGSKVSKDELLVGDILVFSNDGSGSNVGHVGIYIGDGKFAHASTPTSGLRIDELSSNYYTKNYIGAKRVLF